VVERVKEEEIKNGTGDGKPKDTRTEKEKLEEHIKIIEQTLKTGKYKTGRTVPDYEIRISLPNTLDKYKKRLKELEAQKRGE
jgi:hypothetical protein